jgi:hypothetical protein
MGVHIRVTAAEVFTHNRSMYLSVEWWAWHEHSEVFTSDVSEDDAINKVLVQLDHQLPCILELSD